MIPDSAPTNLATLSGLFWTGLLVGGITLAGGGCSSEEVGAQTEPAADSLTNDAPAPFAPAYSEAPEISDRFIGYVEKTLPDGRKIDCLIFYTRSGGGLDCDWGQP